MTQPPEQPPTQRAPHNQPPQAPQPPVPPAQQYPVAPPPAPAPAPGPYGGGGAYPPYAGGQAPYGGAPSPYQPRKSGGGKTVAIVVTVVVVLVLAVCGGVIGLIVWAANNVDDSFDEFDSERTGGRDNPITVEVGESFEIDGIEYAEGWQIQPPTDEYSGATIVGLEGENEREDESSESVYLNFTFVGADDNEVGQITCSSNGTIAHGNTEELECRGYDQLPETYDHIEVAASF